MYTHKLVPTPAMDQATAMQNDAFGYLFQGFSASCRNKTVCFSLSSVLVLISKQNAQKFVRHCLASTQKSIIIPSEMLLFRERVRPFVFWGKSFKQSSIMGCRHILINWSVAENSYVTALNKHVERPLTSPALNKAANQMR